MLAGQNPPVDILQDQGVPAPDGQAGNFEDGFILQ
jgi:hypothetical protein